MVSRIELGEVGSVTVGAIDHVATAIGARLEVRALWHGEATYHLLDGAHAH